MSQSCFLSALYTSKKGSTKPRLYSPADINTFGHFWSLLVCSCTQDFYLVTDYDICSWSGDVVLRFADGEGRRQKGKCRNLEMAWWAVHLPTQPVVITHPSLPPFPLSQLLTSPSEDCTPCSFSGHNTMEAWCRRHRETHCVILCESQFVADWQCWGVR